MSSKTTTSGACSSSSFRNAQAISSPLVATIRLAQERAHRRRRDRIRRQHRELLHDLHHRPVGDPVSVGQAAAPDDASLDRGERLRHQPRLAHAGVADHRHELAARLRLRALPRLDDLRELRARVRRTATRGCAPARPAPRRAGYAGTGSDFPFSAQRLHRLGHHRLVHERMRRLADQHLARRRRLLEPRRHVHRVPGRQPLLRPGHHLAGVHADPAADAQLRQRVAHLHRRPARPQRVVLVRRGDPEHRHHRVADELLHRPAVRLDDRLHPLEVARQQRPQRLRIGRLPERRRAGDVAEQHRHRLADLARSRRRRERRATRRCRSRRLPGCPARSSRR